MAGLLAGQGLVHPLDVVPGPGRPEEGRGRQGAYVVRVLHLELLGQDDAVVVPLAGQVGVVVLGGPAVEKGAVLAGYHDGVAQAAAVPALVAHENIAWGSKEVCEGTQAESIHVEVDAALFSEQLEAHDIGNMSGVPMHTRLVLQGLDLFRGVIDEGDLVF